MSSQGRKPVASASIAKLALPPREGPTSGASVVVVGVAVVVGASVVSGA